MPGWWCVVPTLAQRLVVPVAEPSVLLAGGGADAVPLAAERATTKMTGCRADEVFEVLPAGETTERPSGMRVTVVPGRVGKRLPPVGGKAPTGAACGLHHQAGIVLYVRDTEALLRA